MYVCIALFHISISLYNIYILLFLLLLTISKTSFTLLFLIYNMSSLSLFVLFVLHSSYIYALWFPLGLFLFQVSSIFHSFLFRFSFWFSLGFSHTTFFFCWDLRYILFLSYLFGFYTFHVLLFILSILWICWVGFLSAITCIFFSLFIFSLSCLPPTHITLWLGSITWFSPLSQHTRLSLSSLLLSFSFLSFLFTCAVLA